MTALYKSTRRCMTFVARQPSRRRYSCCLRRSLVKCCALFLIIGGSAFASDTASTQIIQCEARGCTLRCTGETGVWQRMGSANEIELTPLSNGAIMYKLKMSQGKVSTVISGPKTYLCQISGQKN